MDWRQVVAGEYQVLALLAGPLTVAAVGWALRQLTLHLRDTRVRTYVARLVAWAQQAIPDKSERYMQVANLLSTRFPALKAADVEVLIESEVHALKSAQLPAISPGLSALSRQLAAGTAAPAPATPALAAAATPGVPTVAATATSTGPDAAPVAAPAAAPAVLSASVPAATVAPVVPAPGPTAPPVPAAVAGGPS